MLCHVEETREAGKGCTKASSEKPQGVLHAKAVRKYLTEKATAILQILHREAYRKCWCRLNYSTKKTRSRSILSMKVSVEDGQADEADEFKTEEGVFWASSKKLSNNSA